MPCEGARLYAMENVEAGRLSEYYEKQVEHQQVEHQLMVTKAEVADVFIFDGTDGMLLEVAPQPETWPRIRAATQLPA